VAKGEGISGAAVAAIFAGGILAWSGIKGYSVSTTIKDVLAGKDPTKQTPTESVTPSGLFGSLFGGILGGLLGGGGSSGSGSNVNATVSGPGMTAFATGVLAAIGAPTTGAAGARNIASIAAWARREGGGGSNNPLNTTLGPSGASNFNSVGVKNFTSLTEGATWTVRTLLGGGYSDVLSALRSGRGLCGQSFSGLSRWSGGGYSSVC
jgi:hypothetical protein